MNPECTLDNAMIEMTEPGLLRCQRCGKALGYVTITAKGLTSIAQRVRDVKLIAICMECFHKNR